MNFKTVQAAKDFSERVDAIIENRKAVEGLLMTIDRLEGEARTQGAQLREYRKENAITKKQTVALDFIRDFINEHGYSPTVKEMADGLDMNVNGAQHHITKLIKKGRLSKVSGCSRTLVVIEEKSDE